MHTVKILIACGGGIATSSYAAAEIEKIAKEAGISVDVHKDRIVNVPSDAKDYDLCCVTARYTQEISTPVIQVNGLITGIREEEVREQIKNKLIELNSKEK